jgi:endonuclease YncB( thermonuclease family)
MTGSHDNNDRYDDDDLYGPSEADLERFNREDRKPESPGIRRIRIALWKLIAGLVITILVASMLLNVIVPVFGGDREVITGPERVPATVTRMFDGRTIAVDINGIEHTVRYIGLDIPEYGNVYYELAIEANRQWIGGQEVLLESDKIETDSEGRLLRYVWFGEAMINLNLLASGLAKASATDANNRYSDYFHDLEAQARSRNIGIWDTGTTAGTSFRKFPASSSETGLSDT